MPTKSWLAPTSRCTGARRLSRPLPKSFVLSGAPNERSGRLHTRWRYALRLRSGRTEGGALHPRLVEAVPFFDREVVAQLIDDWLTGRDLQTDDLVIADVRQMLDDPAQRIAVRCDQHAL